MYPTETIELPSKGLFYEESNPLSSGKVELIQPTAKHEDILTSRNLISKGIVIDELLKELLVNKDINYDTLLSLDKSAIIIAARILLYGSKYEAKTNCSACGETNLMEINLTDLEVKEVDMTSFTPGINEFEFELPISKSKIKFKLLTVADELSISKDIKLMKKNFVKRDAEVTTRLSYIITNYDGELSRQKIKQKVRDEMNTQDVAAFKSHLAKNFPGIDDKVLFECNFCEHSEAITLPMDVNFFWPSSRE